MELSQKPVWRKGMAQTPGGNQWGLKSPDIYTELLRLCGHPQIKHSSGHFPFKCQFMSGTTMLVDLITDSHP